ncbi:hypothetical protein Tco_0242447 [Tanacetum coccineum]
MIVVSPTMNLNARNQFANGPCLIAPSKFAKLVRRHIELVRRNDYCKLRCHLLSESESKVLVPSFGISVAGQYSVVIKLSPRCLRESIALASPKV